MTNPLTEIFASLLDVDLLNKTEELTEELRSEATKLGWPVIVVGQLSVVVRNDDFDVDYPDAIKETVLLLEYGTEDIPPRALIRPFLKDLKKGMSR